MLIRDKKLIGLSLVRDDMGNYIGRYNEDNNSIYNFKKPVHNLYNLFNNFNEYFPDWDDQGFGIFINNSIKGTSTIIIKDKVSHEINADIVIKDNSLKMYPEIRDKFIEHCRKRLDKTEYVHIQINENNKEKHYSIDKYGNFMRICDVKGFLAKYPYFPDLSFVPKLFYREIHLVEESIARKHDVGLDFCLKLATDMTDEDILCFQDSFRKDIGLFMFDKCNKEHLEYLVNYLKEKSPDNKHFNVINLLYSTHGYEYRELEVNPNSYCIKYTHGMKKELINLIVKDKDCVNVINTNVIPKKYRNDMIRKDNDLIKKLRYMYHEDIDIKYLKEYIDKDILNLRFVNVAVLLKKDFEYACETMNKYLQDNNVFGKDSITDKLLIKYSGCIKETTIKKCIETFPVNSLHLLTRMKDSTKYIPFFVNRLNGIVFDSTNDDIKKSINKVIAVCEEKYEFKFNETDHDVTISVMNKETGKIVTEIIEPHLCDDVNVTDKEKLLDTYWEDSLECFYEDSMDNTFAEAYSKQLNTIFGF